MGKESLMSYEDALERVLDEARHPGHEDVCLENLAGRVLAADVSGAYDLPAFDNSAMDGYAVRCPVQGLLRLIGEVKAGDAGSFHVEHGTCARIFTGAPIPDGADAVVMQERVSIDNGFVTAPRDVRPGDFVRRRGEEFRKGDPVLRRGAAMTPATVGCLAAAGFAAAPVYRKMQVAVVETGSELTQPGSALMDGGVFAANGFALAAALEAVGCTAKRFTVADDAGATKAMLEKALEASDMVVTSGGVSVGEYDLVRPALAELGVEERFWRVAIRPGKPVYFGTRKGGAAVFGLPGNPGSALVTFLLFVRPFVLRCFGIRDRAWEPTLTSMDVEPSPSVETFMRVQVSGARALPVARQGSNMISSVAEATHLMRIPAGNEKIERGTPLNVSPIAWAL